MFWQKFRLRLLIGLLIVWILWSLLPHFHTNALEIWMLDVGQGESVLLREPSGKLLLYDGGPDDSVLQQLGSVLPPWQRRIDLIVLSHNHSDHVTGLLGVMQRYQVGEVWLSGAKDNTPQYYQFKNEIQQYHIQTRISYFHTEECQRLPVCPAPIPFGEATLQVYHPLADATGMFPHDQHDATVSIKVGYAGSSIFLAGDLNEEHEQGVLNACVPPKCSLQTTVLQEPHHGSVSGLLPAFLAATNPRIDLIPVGLNNKFHHPRPEILAKLRVANISVWRTDLNGRIHVVLRKNGTLSVQPEHQG